MAFHNVVFPERYSQGAVGGPGFRTTIVTTGSGYEQRNSDWQSARNRYDVSHVLTTAELREEFITFFRARKGSAHGFLFKDWMDYFAGMVWNSSTKTLDHDAAHNFAVGDGVETVFKIYKVYSSGGAEERRRITRPKSAIKVYVNDVEVTTGFSVNYSTGTITFTSAPALNDDIGWSGEFYVPVRFESDDLNMEATSPNRGDVSLGLLEIREP